MRKAINPWRPCESTSSGGFIDTQSPALGEADRFLLRQVRAGDGDGWSQLVDRYRGRLLAFARRRTRSVTDAEDLVQDTFVKFLTALPSFRGDASLETFLFTILRRRIIDTLRLRRLNVCSLTLGDEDISPPSFEPTASWHARRREEYDGCLAALAHALTHLIDTLKGSAPSSPLPTGDGRVTVPPDAAQPASPTPRLQDLQLAEALFYAQLRNPQAAQLTAFPEPQVALKKHRWLKQLHASVTDTLRGQAIQTLWDSPESLPGSLTQIWESHRLTCPKRSTLGRYLLGTLDPRWQQYVRFHAETLGCTFCRANLDDMNEEINAQPAPALQDRILQSTIGFFRKT